MSELHEVLKENPWRGFQLEGNAEFVLPDDQDAITRYNKGRENDETYIRLDAPPQPYIGNPTAPIWLLMKNPSYSPVDEAEITGVIPENLQELVGIQMTFKETSSPEARRNLLQAQLSFTQKSPFYPLEKDFNVWVHGGHSPQGSYRWWRQKLLGTGPNAAPVCKGNRKRLISFFNLEFFPYHSKNYGAIDGLAHQTAHHRFWQKMVEYALRNDKILILRGQTMLTEVRQAAGGALFQRKIGNIFFTNPRQASVSVRNLNLVDGFTPAGNEGEMAYIARRLAEAMGLTEQEKQELLQ